QARNRSDRVCPRTPAMTGWRADVLGRICASPEVLAHSLVEHGRERCHISQANSRATEIPHHIGLDPCGRLWHSNHAPRGPIMRRRMTAYLLAVLTAGFSGCATAINMQNATMQKPYGGFTMPL